MEKMHNYQKRFFNIVSILFMMTKYPLKKIHIRAKMYMIICG